MCSGRPDSVHRLHFPPPNWPQKDYRCGVGLVVINTDGKVWAGQRMDNPDLHWQLPQGGVHACEDILAAAYRELQEETGITAKHLSLLEVAPQWVRYDFPPDLQRRLWRGKFLGQQQLWIALRFLGTDANINIHGERRPEFRNWSWMPFSVVQELVVPFKQEVYDYVATIFAHLWKDAPNRT